MLNRSSVLKSLLLIQGLGFLGLIGFIWADEALDWTNKLFGQPKLPFNFVEAATESTIALVLGIFVMLYTSRLINRIKYLEGFISLCAYCKKVRVKQNWIPLETFLSNCSEAQFSHGFCPDCMQKHYGAYLNGAASMAGPDISKIGVQKGESTARKFSAGRQL
ncbi:MAG: hypothetical protein K1X79_08760 [Oligoflexia bacterium]|nr:hypothetical protein [Oligoflexia bacterium]